MIVANGNKWFQIKKLAENNTNVSSKEIFFIVLRKFFYNCEKFFL